MLVENYTSIVWLGFFLLIVGIIFRYYEIHINKNTFRVYPSMMLLFAALCFMMAAVYGASVTYGHCLETINRTATSGAVTAYNNTITCVEGSATIEVGQLWFYGALSFISFAFLIIWGIEVMVDVTR
jgi:hypothetical protein